MASNHFTKILSLSIKPDRFGRLIIIAQFSGIVNKNYSYIERSIITPAELKHHRYQVGDFVVVRTVGGFNRIVQMLSPAVEELCPLIFPPSQCPVCRSDVINKQGNYYCCNLHCMGVEQERLRYASQPYMLDLPFDDTMLHDIMLHSPNIDNLGALLNITEHELIPFYDSSERDYILEQLSSRTSQLYGHADNTEPHVQQLVQAKILDALSIPDLFAKQRNLIHKDLCYDTSLWAALPDLLTDPIALLKYQIPLKDSLAISEHVSLRINELDQLCREF